VPHPRRLLSSIGTSFLHALTNNKEQFLSAYERDALCIHHTVNNSALIADISAVLLSKGLTNSRGVVPLLIREMLDMTLNRQTVYSG
jgi:hypothetical protein